MKSPRPNLEIIAAAKIVEAARIAAEKIVEQAIEVSRVAAEKVVERAAATATDLVTKTATRLDADERLRALEAEKQMRDALIVERVLSGESYAKILVEKIVFGFVALIAIGFVGALLALVFR